VSELFRIFIDVLTPVFVIVGVGYLVAGRLTVDAGTLSKLAYWILGPAFIFDVLAGTDLEGAVVLRVVLVSLATMVVTGAIAVAVARAMGRTRSEASATLLTSVHGNVGNFGIAISAFAFGERALPLAGIVMVTVNTAGILTGVAAATSRTSGPFRAVRTAFLAPMALAVLPAVAVNFFDIALPVVADRPIALLADALIPMMLLTLGIQLGQMARPHVGSLVAVPIAAKLAVAPAVAAALAGLGGLAGLPGDVVIVQAAMPAAVFTSLVALEHDMEPDLVTTIVLAGTLVSVITLPAVLTLV
jgi:predicted permease